MSRREGPHPLAHLNVGDSQSGGGPFATFAFFDSHGAACMICGAPMRSVLVLLLLALALAACGTKGALYLPLPEDEAAPGTRKK